MTDYEDLSYPTDYSYASNEPGSQLSVFESTGNAGLIDAQGRNVVSISSQSQFNLSEDASTIDPSIDQTALAIRESFAFFEQALFPGATPFTARQEFAQKLDSPLERLAWLQSELALLQADIASSSSSSSSTPSPSKDASLAALLRRFHSEQHLAAFQQRGVSSPQEAAALSDQDLLEMGVSAKNTRGSLLRAFKASLHPSASPSAQDDLQPQVKTLQAQLEALISQQLGHSKLAITASAEALLAVNPPAGSHEESQLQESKQHESQKEGGDGCARLARLEERLSRLEGKTLGVDPAPSAPLGQRVEAMQRQLAALSPEALDVLEARARLMVAEQQKNQGELEIVSSKILELEELQRKMEEWDATCQDLPRVVERLNSLKRVHDASISFSQHLQSLESSSETALQILKSNEELLKQVQEGFQSNFKVILSNCETLASRLQNISIP